MARHWQNQNDDRRPRDERVGRRSDDRMGRRDFYNRDQSQRHRDPESRAERFGFEDLDDGRLNLGESSYGYGAGFESDSMRDAGRPMSDPRSSRMYGAGQDLEPRMRRDFNYGNQNFGGGFGGGMDQGLTGLDERKNHAGRGPKGWRRSDERIKDEVCEILEREPQVDASEIEVDVNQGIVTLRGHVDSRLAKRRAEDCIEDCPGVKDIRNELSVDQSLFQQAKELITGESSGTSRSKTTDTKRH